MTRPLCSCHGSPCYWQKDRRCKQGGWWECAVKRCRRERDRYDADPVFRIEKQLHDAARNRRATLERKRASLAAERG